MTGFPLDLLAGIVVVAAIVVFVLARRRRARPTSPAPQSTTAAAATAAPARARLTGRAHLLRSLPPSSARGPEPVRIPVSGYSVVVETQVEPGGSAEVAALRVEVLERLPLDADATHLADDGVPLATPQFEVLLDTVPPTVRPALGADGRPLHPTVTLPVTIPDDGQPHALVLAPVTAAMDLVHWRLTVDLRRDGVHSVSWDLMVTGDTGWRTFVPGGDGPRMTPPEKAADHWGLKFPATPTLE